MRLQSISPSDPSPGVSSHLRITLETNAGIYAGSSIKVTFVAGFVIDSTKYKCRLVYPLVSQGTCSHNGLILTISSAVGIYIHTGKVVIQVDDFTNPGTANDYQGFNIQILSAANDMIMSSHLIPANLQVAYSVFQKQPDSSCAGQCQTCGPTIEKCLSCFNPGKSPLFDPANKACLQQCSEG